MSGVLWSSPVQMHMHGRAVGANLPKYAARIFR